MPEPTRSLFGWWTKLERSPREVERDIEDEIAFHLDCAARELEARGVSADEARATARKCFGDVAAVAKACRKTQLGARIMLQRIQLVLLVALVLVMGAMFWRSQAAQTAARDEMASLRGEITRLAGVISARPLDPTTELPPRLDRYASWSASFENAPDGRATSHLADELAVLAPADSTAVLQHLFASNSMSGGVRLQVLAAFTAYGGKSNALLILQLGMLHGDRDVRRWARSYLRSYAWRMLPTDEEALEWCRANAGDPIASVLERSTAAFFEQLEKSDAETTFALLSTVDPLVLSKFGTNRVRDGVRYELARWMNRHALDWDDALCRRAAGEAVHFGLDTYALPPAVRVYFSRSASRR